MYTFLMSLLALGFLVLIWLAVDTFYTWKRTKK